MPDSMLEIELKFPVATFAGVEAALTNGSAQAQPALAEADHYFNAPDRDFAKTDEAFRLRRIGARNLITYKGPKQEGPAKTRTEIEVPLADGAEAAETFCRLVERLAYRPTAVVKKRRRQFTLQRDGFALHVCLDDVERLGKFVEVEIVTPPQQRANAEKTLQAVAADLGLSNSERRSYLEMILELERPDPPLAA
jgi:adenylate cyclase class 2